MNSVCFQSEEHVFFKKGPLNVTYFCLTLNTPLGRYWLPTFSRQVPNLANARISTLNRYIFGGNFSKKEDTSFWNISDTWRARNISIYCQNACIGDIWYLARLGRLPVWFKHSNACAGSWALHPYQVSSTSIKRFCSKDWLCGPIHIHALVHTPPPLFHLNKYIENSLKFFKHLNLLYKHSSTYKHGKYTK